MTKKILITGGVGFSGSAFVEYLVENTDWKITLIDRFSYAGRLASIAHIPQHNIKIVYHDFSSPFTDKLIRSIEEQDYFCHMGAETNVLNSFNNPKPFIDSNVIGTMNVLEAARMLQPEKILNISTDEAIASVSDLSGNPKTELDKLNPSNVYSATKCCAELMGYSYHRSYGVPVITTRTSNMFGPRQHVEKFVPMTIGKILRGETVDIHVKIDKETGEQQMGSRQWTYVVNQAVFLHKLLISGVPGQIYHLSGIRKTNLEIAHLLGDLLGKIPKIRFVDVLDKWRGHDLHYNVAGSHISLPIEYPFEESMQKTIEWYADPKNRSWL